MRFKPKIADGGDEWDDEASDLQLPGDLAELGNQLRDDAQHLARLHPPWSEYDHGQRPGTSNNRRRIFTSLGAIVSIATLLLVTVGVVVFRSAVIEPPESTPSAGVKVADESLERRPQPWFALTTPDNARTTLEGNRFALPPVFVTPQRGSSALHLPHDTSILQTGGPRAEAYLDYIEMTTVRNVKLSL